MMKTPRELLLDRHRHIVPRLRAMRPEEISRMQMRARRPSRTARLGRVLAFLSMPDSACALCWVLVVPWMLTGGLEGWVFLATRRDPCTVQMRSSVTLTPAETLARL